MRSAIRPRKMVRSFSGAPVSGESTRLPPRTGSPGTVGGQHRGQASSWSSRARDGRYWDATTTAEWRPPRGRWPGLSRAPVVVVVLVSPAKYMERYAEPDKASSDLGPEAGEAAWPVPYWFFDAGASVMALLLAATDAGLGACFLGNFRGEAELLDALGVEGDWRFAGAVLIGEPGR